MSDLLITLRLFFFSCNIAIGNKIYQVYCYNILGRKGFKLKLSGFNSGKLMKIIYKLYKYIIII